MIYTCSCCEHVEYREQVVCGAYYCTAHNVYMYPGSKQCEDFRLRDQITDGNQDKEEGLVMSSRCDVCVADRSQCAECRENPVYANVPTHSLFQAYIPTCPRGYDDCVCDPAYIKCHHPKWYEELYGDMSPEEASLQSCHKRVEEDPDEEYDCYDDEDK